MVFYKRIGFWLLVITVIAVAFFLARNSLEKTGVRGYEVSKKELVISVTATSTGTIKADKEVRLPAQRSGRISKLFVEEGSLIEKGGLAAELEFDEALQRLQISQATLERMRANLEGLRLALKSFRIEVESNIERTATILNETGARMKRFAELREKGYLSQNEFDSVKREYDIAKANHTSALSAGDQIKSKEADIKAQDAAVKQAAGEHVLAKINHDYSFIRSPMGGIITSRPVKVGDTVNTGSLIASVVSPDSLYIEAFIDEADVAKISIGQQVNISMDAYQGKVFRGEVYMISPVVLGGKQEARTFEVRVRFLEKGIIIKPGMSADVEVLVDRVRDLLIVPSQAVMEKSEGRSAFVIQKGKAVLTHVKTGRYNWNFTEVTEGIKERDVVITNPDAPGLVDGSRVKLIKTEK